MTCNHFRELASAGIDNEITAADRPALDDHLETCPSCRAYLEQSWALRRALRLSVVPPESRGAARVNPAIRSIPSIRSASAMRWTLFVIGGTLVALNLHSVLFAGSGAAAHLGRHDGVFGTALGVAMLAVALKPQRAIGLVPLTSAVTLLMAVAATADVMAGRTSVLSEGIHAVEFAGLVCLWVISGGPSRAQQRTETMLGGLRRSTVPPWPTS